MAQSGVRFWDQLFPQSQIALAIKADVGTTLKVNSTD
jgi:hypothetical protein